MRKVISLLLCVALLCSLVVITAQADAVPTPSIPDVTSVPGGTVVINCSLDSNPGLAAIRFRIVDEDGLGATYAGADNDADTMSLTTNDALGAWFWSSYENNYNLTFGTVAITIPDDAELGEYEFTVYAEEGADEVPTSVALGSSTFTVTVTDKIITGVNVAIDAGLSIGVHVQATDIENVSITLLDEAKKEFVIVDGSEAEEGDGDYVFYLNVNPWAMNAEFKVDFTENFDINDQETEEIDDDTLNLDAIPATAKVTGILSYCTALLANSPSNELVQLIADLLAYGQAAQEYSGVTVMALPAGLEPTEAEWLDSEENPTTFGGYCSENYPEDTTGKNATAKKKFKFVSVDVEFGSQFVATFTVDKPSGGTATAISNARMKVDGETYSFEATGANSGTYAYTFSPAQYAGVEFDLYASSSTTATNFAWINNYGPAHYAAYLYDNAEEGAADDLLDLLEAFYLLGASTEAYAGSLGE